MRFAKSPLAPKITIVTHFKSLTMDCCEEGAHADCGAEFLTLAILGGDAVEFFVVDIFCRVVLLQEL